MAPHRMLAFLCLLAFGSAVAPDGTAAQAESAEAYLKKHHRRVLKMLRDKPRSDEAKQARNQQLDRELERLLALDELSKRALGDHWDERGEEERARFVELLQQLVQRNYQQNLESTLSYSVRYKGESGSGEGVVVHTIARSTENRRAPPIEIDYRMMRGPRGWQVFDIITDGVSLVDNYRRQFSRIIKKDGWDALIERMESRLDSMET